MMMTLHETDSANSGQRQMPLLLWQEFTNVARLAATRMLDFIKSQGACGTP